MYVSASHIQSGFWDFIKDPFGWAGDQIEKIAEPVKDAAESFASIQKSMEGISKITIFILLSIVIFVIVMLFISVMGIKVVSKAKSDPERLKALAFVHNQKMQKTLLKRGANVNEIRQFDNS